MRLPLCLLLVALATAGCDQAGVLADESARPGAPLEGGDPYSLTGFVGPESVVHDPAADVYYVSNIGDLDTPGFVSRIAASVVGDVTGEPGYVWIDDVVSPAGLALDGQTLYVVDVDGLHAYDIDPVTGDATPSGFFALGGPGSALNDPCVAGDGAVYVTDTGIDFVTGAPTGTDALYRVEPVNGTVEVYYDDAAEEGPNGCLTNGANVYWVAAKTNAVYRTNPSGRRFLVGTLPTGGLDGIVRVGGTLYVTSWNQDPFGGAPTGVVYRMSMGGGDVEPVVEAFFTPADLGYDGARHRLLIPSLFSPTGEVAVLPLD